MLGISNNIHKKMFSNFLKYCFKYSRYPTLKSAPKSKIQYQVMTSAVKFLCWWSNLIHAFLLCRWSNLIQAFLWSTIQTLHTSCVQYQISAVYSSGALTTLIIIYFNTKCKFPPNSHIWNLALSFSCLQTIHQFSMSEPPLNMHCKFL